MAAIKRLNNAKKADSDNAPDASNKLGGKEYERELARLHGELVKLQLWVVAKGLKVVIVFEGRDGADRAALSRRLPSASVRASIASSHCPRRPSASSRRCMFNATCGICRRRAKS
jgi:polyphosphate kinase 2 (PPK2 family)